MDDTINLDPNRYKIKYPSPSYGLYFPLTIFDNIDISIRTTIGIVAAGSICLFEDEETVNEEYPQCFLMVIVVLALSLFPYAGGLLSHGFSFLWGSFLATIAVIIVTNILDNDIESTIETVPTGLSTCIPSPVIVPLGTPLPATIPQLPFNSTAITIDLDGEIADPSPYLLAFFVFFGTFCFIYFGENKFFILGAVVVYDFYLANWYATTQIPLKTIPDSEIFWKTTRSIIIGICISFGSFILPLPKLIPTFIPQPRFACSTIYSQLSLISKKLTNNFSDIVLLLEDMNEYNNKREMKAQTQSRFLLISHILDECNDTLRKLLLLLKLGGQYEPLWFPLPLFHFITVKRLKNTIIEYQNIVIYQDAIIRSMKIYSKIPSQAPRLPEEFINFTNEFVNEVNKLSNFHILGNPLFCTYPSNNNDIDEKWERYSLKFIQISEEHFSGIGNNNIDINDKTNIISLGFHCYFFWCLRGLCDSIIKIEKLRRLPSNRVIGIILVFLDWPLHLLGWFIEYIFLILSPFKEIKYIIQGKERYSILAFIRRHYARFLGSILASLSCLIAFLFVLIEDWRTRLPTGTTVVIMAVVLIDRDQPSGGFRNGILRMAGSTLGTASAFLVSIFFDDTPEDGLSDTAIILSMMVFSLFGRYLMTNQKYLFFSYTFLTTNIILFFAVNVDFNTFIAFTGLRAVAIGIGIAIATFFMVLWPVKASVRLRHRIRLIVNQCKYLTVDSLLFEKKFTEKNVLKAYEELQRFTFKQQEMRTNAEFEPDILSRPFPVSDYLKILNSEKHLIGDSIITSELLLLVRKHIIRRSDDLDISEIFGQDIIENLKIAFSIVESRTHIPFYGVNTSHIELYNFKTQYINLLPSFNDILQKDAKYIVAICALLFCCYQLFNDLESMNNKITNLSAKRLASTPPGIPIRIPRK